MIDDRKRIVGETIEVNWETLLAEEQSVIKSNREVIPSSTLVKTQSAVCRIVVFTNVFT